MSILVLNTCEKKNNASFVAETELHRIQTAPQAGGGGGGGGGGGERNAKTPFLLLPRRAAASPRKSCDRQAETPRSVAQSTMVFQKIL